MIANRVFRHFVDISRPGALWQSWKKVPDRRAHFDFSYRSAACPKPYAFNPQHPMRQKRGLSTLRSSTATEDGQAASPSALADRKGIWQGPLDCPTRKRRKRRAPLACATATLNKYVGNADGTERLALARSLGRRDPSSVAVLRRVDACPTFGALWFMVLMHAHKRNEAFHERCSSGVESAHSALEK